MTTFHLVREAQGGDQSRVHDAAKSNEDQETTPQYWKHLRIPPAGKIKPLSIEGLTRPPVQSNQTPGFNCGAAPVTRINPHSPEVMAQSPPPPTHSNPNPGTRDTPNLSIISSKNEDKKWSDSMENGTKALPKLLCITAGRSSCSIFRLPQSLVEIHPKAFQPKVVSIGPYHHGREHLQMIQEHKWQYLNAILARTLRYGVGYDDFCKAIANEEEIRECYS
ncbi:hypothetical protein GH714_000945 [Hevea brasiliensis]|uniref:Uncharacterized protein n=1 Tax=Hevea brasiliensis TaxID=3981 RepID=A0A6A6N7N4_HEVBR|nr:hypothetical protein GH714_000945 [Hevea brasiliensis]